MDYGKRFSLGQELDIILTTEVSRMHDRRMDTQQFQMPRDKNTAHDTLLSVYEAMQEKGYDPVNQIVGYLLSGDPTYITSHNNARYLISRMERDELLEELVRFYISRNG